MFPLLFARGLFRFSANTPALAALAQSPPRKGSVGSPPVFLIFVVAFGTYSIVACQNALLNTFVIFTGFTPPTHHS